MVQYQNIHTMYTTQVMYNLVQCFTQLNLIYLIIYIFLITRLTLFNKINVKYYFKLLF
jgi:hypothetical protein